MRRIKRCPTRPYQSAGLHTVGAHGCAPPTTNFDVDVLYLLEQLEFLSALDGCPTVIDLEFAVDVFGVGS